MAVCQIYFLVILSTLNVIHAENIIRANVGAVFGESGTIQAPFNWWAHTIQVPLPIRVWHDINLSLCENGTVCETIVEIQKQLLYSYNLTCERLDRAYRQIWDTFPQQSLFRLEKLLDSQNYTVADDFTKFIYSPSKRDLKVLKQHVGQFEELGEHTPLSFRAHIPSFSSMSKHRLIDIGDLVKTIQRNQKDLDLMTKVVSSTIAEYSEIVAAHIDLQYKLDLLEKQVNRLFSHLYFLKNGRMSPLMITPSTLQSVMDTVQEYLDDEYPGYSIQQNASDFYYGLFKFFHIRHGNNIYISIKFPIASPHNTLSLYKLSTFSLPLNDSISSSIKLANVPNFFAISADGEYYSAMTENEVDDCHKRKWTQCDTLIPMTTINASSCVSALYLDSVDDFLSMCDYELTQQDTEPALKQITPTRILLINIVGLTVNCMGVETMHTGCTFCIAQLPCECYITAHDLYIPIRLDSNCDNTTQVHIQYPINLPALKHLSKVRVKKELRGNTALAKPFNVPVPEITILGNKLSDSDVAIDENERISLQKVAAAIKNDDELFLNLDEKILRGEANIPQPSFSTARLFDMFNMLLTAFCVTFGMYVVTRMRDIWALIVPPNVAEQHEKHRGPLSKMF